MRGSRFMGVYVIIDFHLHARKGMEFACHRQTPPCSRPMNISTYSTFLNLRRIWCHGMACALRASLACVLLAAMPHDANAQQRNPLQTIADTVADVESAHYRFERFTVSSMDASRTWRVRVGVPKGRQPPEAGWPSFWMLDGNAALIEFDPPLLAELAAQPLPQVLVFISHDNQLRTDSAQRNRDYTPRVLPAEEATGPLGNGGADAFLEVIERRVRPQVEQIALLDPGQRSLWGHSLGGLFTLHTLFTRTGAFNTYIAASPSMWWGQAYAVNESERFIAHNAGQRARVIIHLGGLERIGDRGPRDLNNPRVVAHLKRIQAAAPDAAMQLAQRLTTVSGIDADYREFPGLGHGPMLRASLMAALHTIAGVADRSGTPRPTPEN